MHRLGYYPMLLLGTGMRLQSAAFSVGLETGHWLGPIYCHPVHGFVPGLDRWGVGEGDDRLSWSRRGERGALLDPHAMRRTR